MIEHSTMPPYSLVRSASFISVLGLACFGLNAFQPTVPAAQTVSGGQHWVSTWGCAPQLTEPANLPPSPGLSTNTLRQVVHVSIGGKRIRVWFSNAFGTNSVTIDSAHVAISAGGSAIEPSSQRALSFKGGPSISIAPGDSVQSDPLDFPVAPLSNLAVSIHFGDTSGAVTGHPGSRTTSYIQSGDCASCTGLPTASKTAHWYILTGIDVQADDSSATVVTLGDSITDGRGSTTDGNNRWPDNLARRLSTNAPTASMAVVNQGIGGNAVVTGGLGPTALKRFDRDVLGTSGVRWLIVLEGVNDIGSSRSQAVVTNLISAYEQFIQKAHEHNLRVYGGTITPFGGSFYNSPSHESARQAVNDWIRTSGKFDSVVDFDAALRDPGNPTHLLPAYDTGDHLHPNVAGYQKMAETIDLTLFAR
jgi:lysophospholipase L1-like esterase